MTSTHLATILYMVTRAKLLLLGISCSQGYNSVGSECLVKKNSLAKSIFPELFGYVAQLHTTNFKDNSEGWPTHKHKTLTMHLWCYSTFCLLCAKCIIHKCLTCVYKARGNWYNSSGTLPTFLSTFMAGVVAHTHPRIWETDRRRKTSEFETHLLYMASRFTFIGGGHAYHMWSGGQLVRVSSLHVDPRNQTQVLRPGGKHLLPRAITLLTPHPTRQGLSLASSTSPVGQQASKRNSGIGL